MPPYKRLNFDIPLFLAVIALVIAGIIMVFSSSSLLAVETYHQAFYFMIQQILGALAGFGIVVILLAVKKPFLMRPHLIYSLLAVTGFMLLLCLVMPQIAHTRRWVIFAGLRFQPSELAKISLILFFAYFCEAKKDNLNAWKTLAVPLSILGAAVLLVLLEPDYGTALFLAVLSCLMMVIGGVKLGRILAVGGVFAILFTIFLFTANYRIGRLRGFVSSGGDPQGRGYQVTQSTNAVGSGGLLGVSIGQSTQKLYFLPFAHTDFIFAILGEETGLVGTMITVFLFIVVLWRGVKIAMAAPDPALKMVAAGVTFAIVAQALLNITIVLGWGPTKGMPLPFLSYGRSSLMCSLAMAGVLLYISQKKGSTPAAVRP